MKLISHPRLYATKPMLNRLSEPLKASAPSLLHGSRRSVLQSANRFLQSETVDFDKDSHNALLVRARGQQTRVVNLLAAWKITGKGQYRAAAIRHLQAMEKWEYWSWVSERAKDKRPDSFFDLSYGENSATLALAWDWLYDSLNAKEKALLLGMVKKWVFPAFLRLDEPGFKSWWFKHPGTNWNTVCAGGAGMVALAFMEEFPKECSRVITLVEQSFLPYMKSLDKTDGAWPEGIGYWGYGMRYAFMYLLSYENATGKSHSLMNAPSVERTLSFPLDFSPNNCPISFGDVNQYLPVPVHYLAALRFKRTDIVTLLDQCAATGITDWQGKTLSWPNNAETLLFHPRDYKARFAKEKGVVSYKGQDWFLLRDKWPNPNLALSLRGGTTEVNHGHRDLFSWQCVAGSETMVHNISQIEYVDSTFGPARFQIPEMVPQCKNTILVNGVGIQKPSTVTSRSFFIKGLPAVEMSGAQAFGTLQDGTQSVKKVTRTFILLGRDAALIVDRVTPTFPARVECRLHTLQKASVKKELLSIAGTKEHATVAFASTEECLLELRSPVLTDPGRNALCARWITKALTSEVVMATLLVRGKKAPTVSLKRKGKKTVILCKTNGKNHSIEV